MTLNETFLTDKGCVIHAEQQELLAWVGGALVDTLSLLILKVAKDRFVQCDVPKATIG